MKPLKTLVELLEERPIIFSDTDIDALGWYRDYIYECNTFSDLNVSRLSKVIKSLERTKAWFSNPVVLTTPRIVEEMRRFVGIIHNTRDIMHSRASFPELRGKVPSKGLYERIVRMSDEIFALAESAVFVPEDVAKFEALEKAVITIAANSHAKVDYSKRYGKTARRYSDLHGDESLVAAAFYVSLVCNEPCAIVTPDSDIKRLVSKAHMLIANGEVPEGRKFFEDLEKYPVQVYFRSPNGMVCSADTSKYSFHPFFNLPEKDNVTNARVKQAIEEALTEGGFIPSRDYSVTP